MSRIGKKPIVIPDKVKTHLVDNRLTVQGPKGSLAYTIPKDIFVKIDVDKIVVTRANDERNVRALHGLCRSLINNMVIGVSTGFTKTLLIEGVGYRANMKGKTLVLTLGYSHPIEYPIPDGIEVTIEKQVAITVAGFDKEQVGQIAANIRAFRAVEPYLGKGIRYATEHVRRKVGKVGV